MENQRQETDWRSIYTLSFTTFLMSLQMGTVNINLWAYITELDKSISSVFFGYMLSLSSLFNVLATFLAGYFANVIAHTLPAMLMGKVSTVIACLLFISAELFNAERRFIFMVMEAFFGIATGLVSVSRAQIASSSVEQERQKAISIHGFALTTGIATGPFVMTLMSLLKYPGIAYMFGLHFNMFTTPAYFVIACSFVAIMLLIFQYNGKLNEAPIVVTKELKEHLSQLKTHSYDSLAIFICCLTKICTGLTMVFMTAVNNVYIMQSFKWTSAEYVFYQALMNGMSGFAEFNQTVVVEPGCRASHDWCEETPAIDPTLYCVSHVICLSISLPLMMLNIEMLFSTILGPIKQGTQFGIFLVCGEVLNVAGPIIMTQIYEDSGPRLIWTFMIAVHVFVMLAWTVFYPRMIPYSQMIQQKIRNGETTLTAVEAFK
ncbi:Major facilitator superfamily domain-containing protein 8 [Aphelenchoides bicaudatus]|nr:Major facilitator superfamily domain-containing protein 8 [Aphelenchoides bicaudatus]